jgi:aminoglycoside phosphotransferase (APT) family kinase protein
MTSETLGRLVAVGNVAEVFEWDSRVVKLYRSAAAKPTVFREAAIHAAVEALGLPIPAIWGVQQIADRWGIVFDRVGGVSFAVRMRQEPAAIPQYIEILVGLHACIHAHPAEPLGSLKVRLAAKIARTNLLRAPRKQILLGRLAEMPDGDRLCHGDFHPKNVLGEPAQPVVIDWPDACRGDPAADACRSYLLLKHNAEEIAEPYLDAWCRITSVAPARIADWLPYVAAARLAEDVPDEIDRLLEIAHS